MQQTLTILGIPPQITVAPIVATLAPGVTPEVTITGTAPNFELSFAIPQGAQGDIGPANTLQIGSVSTLAAGADATAKITGDAPNQTLAFGIPQGIQGAQGEQGAGATFGSVTTTTLSPGSQATATLGGTAPNYTLALGLPQGLPGTIGNNSGVTTQDRAGAAGYSMFYRSGGVTRFFDSVNNLDTFTCDEQGNVAITGKLTVGGSSVSNALSGRNLIINGSFRVNQRGYASGAALPADGFAHDRWRDYTGTAGATSYTFTEASQGDYGVSHSVDTVITIAAGGALAQPVEGSNMTGLPLTLSWTGTSQATLAFYNNGAFTTFYGPASSPFTVTPPAGDTLFVVFGAGTLGDVQLEVGSTPTPFERRPIGIERWLCMRYYQTSYPEGSPPGTTGGGLTQFYCGNAQGYAPLYVGLWPVEMRTIPSVAIYSSRTGAAGQFDNAGTDAPAFAPFVTAKYVSINSEATSFSTPSRIAFDFTASAEL